MLDVAQFDTRFSRYPQHRLAVSKAGASRALWRTLVLSVYLPHYMALFTSKLTFVAESGVGIPEPGPDQLSN